MIVVAIIGILAAIAVPNFVKFQCRAKQTEAKGGLKVLLVAEDTYRATNDTYIGGNEATDVLDRMLIGQKQRYGYSVDVSDPAHFTGQAFSKNEFDGELNHDRWQTNEIGGLANIFPGCN